MAEVLTFRDILQDVGQAICLELVRLLDERGPHGPLRTNSALRQQLLDGSAIQVEQQRGSGGRFGTYGLTIVALDYLQWLDTGRRPGAKKIPIAALLLFIKQRGIGQVRGKGGRFGKRTISANSLAWAIQISIFKHGIAGRHILDPAWALGQEVMSQLLDESALDLISRDLDQQFTYLSTQK
jgi:hypothetical protein